MRLGSSEDQYSQLKELIRTHSQITSPNFDNPEGVTRRSSIDELRNARHGPRFVCSDAAFGR